MNKIKKGLLGLFGHVEQMDGEEVEKRRDG